MTVVEENPPPQSEGQDQQPADGQQTQSQSQKRPNDQNAMFLRASRAGNLDQVLEFLRNGTDINTCNSNGLNALHLASKEGHNEVVRELIRRGATVDAATKKGNTALHIASLAGQDIVVTILVENGANVNAQSLNGFTPLYMSAQENHESVVRYLIAHGANQGLATEDGFTPLAVALQQGHDRIVALLLENDSNNSRIKLPALHIAAKKDDTRAAALLLQNEQNPNVTSKSGFTPLHIAAHYGNESIAELLLDKGANVNFQARHNISPIHVAAKWGRVNLANLLLTRGAIIDCRTRDLLTPLHCAARSGNDAVVDLLLDKGAPIGAKTKNGLAALHMAAQGDHVDCARILLYHRAPVDDLTVDYLTPLHVAAHCGHVRVAKLLLDRQADPNARALNGFTPLHIACKKNRLKVVELLLKYRASVEATTESGLSPLHVASFMGCINIVIFLIQQGANVDMETIRGETPLHLATRANQTDIVRVLVRNRANVNAQARVLQTPLHIAARLGNTDIVVNLLNANADPNAATRDQYTPLHIAAKEGQEEVVSILLDHRADQSLLTKKGFAPLHLACKYGNFNVAKLLLERGTPVDILGKNQVTPLHVATHYSNEQVAQLLLKNKASAQASAKNGYTPLHIAAKKNQMDIAAQLISYRADPNAESRAGFTPLHLAAEVGHNEMAALLIENGSQVNAQARNGLTPMHLCAQEDRVNVATELLKHGADLNAQTKAGYTPLHVACHYGALNMVRFLLENGAAVGAQTKSNYTPLHQAAQQGHNGVVRCLLEHGASPNIKTTNGQTPLSIAQKLGYVSVVETLKTVTETTVITETTTVTEERYRPQNPEAMNETMFSDSEDEVDEHQAAVGEHARDFNESITQGLRDSAAVHLIHTGEQQPLLAAAAGGQHVGGEAPIDATDADLEAVIKRAQNAPITAAVPDPSFLGNGNDDNSPILHRDLVQPSFLISFLVDARGGAMRGCRHSGVRVIIPPRKAPAPMRITCRYLKREKLSHPPPLSEGEALASRILEMGPHSAKFLGPVILEVPHFASLRGREREIVILRSDDGQHWKEHQLEATEDAVQEVLNESFNASDLQQLDDLHTTRITRILTSDFPMYFAVVTRVRQEVHLVGPEGGVILSSVIQRVQAIFPDGSLTKTIKVSLQAQPVPHELVAKLHGNRVAVSPIVTVEPRRRKFHKPITLYIPLPQGGHRGMLNQYGQAAAATPTQQPQQHAGQDPPTLRLLCSITGGSSPAQWEDITGTTQLTFTGDDVSFTTTVSARFWLMDCQTPRDAARMAQEVYNEAIAVPYMAKFCVFGRRPYPVEGQLRLFCMTDDREDKTLEKQESFVEVARSRDVEVLSNRQQYLEFGGNLVPVAKSGDQLSVYFLPFQENRLAFNVKVRQSDSEEAANAGRIAIMKEARQRAENIPPQHPICTLTITLPDYTGPLPSLGHSPQLGLKKPSIGDNERTPIGVKYSNALALNPADTDLPIELVSRKIGLDWPRLARSLGVPESDVRQIKRELTSNGGAGQEPITILKIWIHLKSHHANPAELEQALHRIGRNDIVRQMNKQEPDHTEGESLRLADASNLAGQNRSNFSSRGSVQHDRVGASPARFANTSTVRDGTTEPPADEVIVTRTERYVHQGGAGANGTGGGPVVDERTITRVYRADGSPEAAVHPIEERVVEVRQPPTDEERRIWREGGTSRSRTDGGAERLINSREAMILDDGSSSSVGGGSDAPTPRTATLVTRHVLPPTDGDSASVSVVSSDDYGSHRVSIISDNFESNAAPSPAAQPIAEEDSSAADESIHSRSERSVSAIGHEEPIAEVIDVPQSPTSSNGSVVLHEDKIAADVPEASSGYRIASASSAHEEDEEELVADHAQPTHGQHDEGLPGFDAKFTAAAAGAAAANGKDNGHHRNGEEPLQHTSTVEELLANEDGSRVATKRLTRVVTTSHSAVSGIDNDYSNGRGSGDDDDSSSVATTSIGSVRDRINIFESIKDTPKAPQPVPTVGKLRQTELIEKLENSSEELEFETPASGEQKISVKIENREPQVLSRQDSTVVGSEQQEPIEDLHKLKDFEAITASLHNDYPNIEATSQYERQLSEENFESYPSAERVISSETTKAGELLEPREQIDEITTELVGNCEDDEPRQNAFDETTTYDRSVYEKQEIEPVKYAELKTFDGDKKEEEKPKPSEYIQNSDKYESEEEKFSSTSRVAGDDKLAASILPQRTHAEEQEEYEKFVYHSESVNDSDEKFEKATHEAHDEDFLRHERDETSSLEHVAAPFDKTHPTAYEDELTGDDEDRQDESVKTHVFETQLVEHPIIQRSYDSSTPEAEDLESREVSSNQQAEFISDKKQSTKPLISSQYVEEIIRDSDKHQEPNEFDGRSHDETGEFNEENIVISKCEAEHSVNEPQPASEIVEVTRAPHEYEEMSENHYNVHQFESEEPASIHSHIQESEAEHSVNEPQPASEIVEVTRAPHEYEEVSEHHYNVHQFESEEPASIHSHIQESEAEHSVNEPQPASEIVEVTRAPHEYEEVSAHHYNIHQFESEEPFGFNPHSAEMIEKDNNYHTFSNNDDKEPIPTDISQYDTTEDTVQLATESEIEDRPHYERESSVPEAVVQLEEAQPQSIDDQEDVPRADENVTKSDQLYGGIVESESYYDMDLNKLSSDDQGTPKIPHLIVEEEASNKSEEEEETEEEEPYEHPIPRYQQKRNERMVSEESESGIINTNYVYSTNKHPTMESEQTHNDASATQQIHTSDMPEATNDNNGMHNEIMEIEQIPFTDRQYNVATVQLDDAWKQREFQTHVYDVSESHKSNAEDRRSTESKHSDLPREFVQTQSIDIPEHGEKYEIDGMHQSDHPKVIPIKEEFEVDEPVKTKNHQAVLFAESSNVEDEDDEDNEMHQLNEGNEMESIVNAETAYVGVDFQDHEFPRTTSVQKEPDDAAAEVICSEQITRYNIDAEDTFGNNPQAAASIQHDVEESVALPKTIEPALLVHAFSGGIVESDSYNQDLSQTDVQRNRSHNVDIDNVKFNSEKSHIPSSPPAIYDVKSDNMDQIEKPKIVDLKANDDQKQAQHDGLFVEGIEKQREIRQVAHHDEEDTEIEHDASSIVQSESYDQCLDKSCVPIMQTSPEDVDPHMSYHSHVAEEITTLSEKELEFGSAVSESLSNFQQEVQHNEDYSPSTYIAKGSSDSIDELNNNDVESSNKDDGTKGVLSGISVDRSSSRDSFETNITDATVVPKHHQSSTTPASPTLNMQSSEESDLTGPTRSLTNEQHFIQIGGELNKINDGKRSSISVSPNTLAEQETHEKNSSGEEDYDIISKDDYDKTPEDKKTEESIDDKHGHAWQHYDGSTLPDDSALPPDEIEESNVTHVENENVRGENEEGQLSTLREQPIIVDSRSIEFSELNQPTKADGKYSQSDSPTEHRTLLEGSQILSFPVDEDVVPMDPSPSSPVKKVEEDIEKMEAGPSIQSENENYMTQSIYGALPEQNDNQDEATDAQFDVIKKDDDYIHPNEGKETDALDDFDIINTDELEQSDIATANITAEPSIENQAGAIVNEVFDRLDMTMTDNPGIQSDVQIEATGPQPIFREETIDLDLDSGEDDAELLELSKNDTPQTLLSVKEEFQRPKSPVPPAASLALSKDDEPQFKEQSFPLKRLEDGDEVFLHSPVQTGQAEIAEKPVTAPIIQSISLTEKLFKTEELPEVECNVHSKDYLLDSPKESHVLPDEQSENEFALDKEDSGSSSASSLKRKVQNNEVALAAATIADNISSEGSLMEFERIEQEVLQRKQEHAKSANGSPSKVRTDAKSAQKEGVTSGSMTSLTEFENLEREIIEDQLASIVAEEDVMVLSDIREESEDAEEVKGELDDRLSVHDDYDYNVDTAEVDSLSEDPRGKTEHTAHDDILVDDIHQVLHDAMLSSADSLELGLRQAHALMETSADSLELGHGEYDTFNRADIDRDSLLDVPVNVSHSHNPSTDTGHMTADTDTTFQDYQHDVDQETLVKEHDADAFSTTTTTFETTKTRDDGSTDTIIRRVETRVTDPIHSHIRFTGTEDQDRLQNVHPREGDDVRQVESVDEEGNVTTTVARRSPPHPQ